MRILLALTHYGESGMGDIKALSGEWDGYFRLRAGDFRVIFPITPDAILIVRYDIDLTCIDRLGGLRSAGLPTSGLGDKMA